MMRKRVSRENSLEKIRPCTFDFKKVPVLYIDYNYKEELRSIIGDYIIQNLHAPKDTTKFSKRKEKNKVKYEPLRI